MHKTEDDESKIEKYLMSPAQLLKQYQVLPQCPVQGGQADIYTVMNKKTQEEYVLKCYRLKKPLSKKEKEDIREKLSRRADDVIKKVSQQLSVHNKNEKEISEDEENRIRKEYARVAEDTIEEILKIRKENAHQRARDEFSLLADLSHHPSVPQVKAVINKAGTAFTLCTGKATQNYEFAVLLEKINGCNLNEIKPLSEKDALVVVYSLIRDVGSVLDFLHNKKKVGHFDVKGGNILYSREKIEHQVDEHVIKYLLHKFFLLDYGIAAPFSQMTQTAKREEIGTVGYMAPELIKKELLSPSSDVYGLGVTVYRFLTDGTTKIVANLNSKKIPSFNKKLDMLPSSLEEIIATMLQENPQKRYKGIRQVQEAFAIQFLTHSINPQFLEHQRGEITSLIDYYACVAHAYTFLRTSSTADINKCFIKAQNTRRDQDEEIKSPIAAYKLFKSGVVQKIEGLKRKLSNFKIPSQSSVIASIRNLGHTIYVGYVKRNLNTYLSNHIQYLMSHTNTKYYEIGCTSPEHNAALLLWDLFKKYAKPQEMRAIKKIALNHQKVFATTPIIPLKSISPIKQPLIVSKREEEQVYELSEESRQKLESRLKIMRAFEILDKMRHSTCDERKNLENQLTSLNSDLMSDYTNKSKPTSPVKQEVDFDRCQSLEKIERIHQLVVSIIPEIDAYHKRGMLHGNINPHKLLIQEDKTELLYPDNILQIKRRFKRKLLPTCQPYYEVPEVAQGHCFVEQSDVYMLAATIYELITKRKPTAAKFRIVDKQIPDSLVKVLLKGLHPSYKKRQANMGEFATDIFHSFVMHQTHNPSSEVLKDIREVCSNYHKYHPTLFAEKHKEHTQLIIYMDPLATQLAQEEKCRALGDKLKYELRDLVLQGKKRRIEKLSKVIHHKMCGFLEQVQKPHSYDLLIFYNRLQLLLGDRYKKQLQDTAKEIIQRKALSAIWNAQSLKPDKQREIYANLDVLHQIAGVESKIPYQTIGKLLELYTQAHHATIHPRIATLEELNGHIEHLHQRLCSPLLCPSIKQIRNDLSKVSEEGCKLYQELISHNQTNRTHEQTGLSETWAQRATPFCEYLEKIYTASCVLPSFALPKIIRDEVKNWYNLKDEILQKSDPCNLHRIIHEVTRAAKKLDDDLGLQGPLAQVLQIEHRRFRKYFKNQLERRRRIEVCLNGSLAHEISKLISTRNPATIEKEKCYTHAKEALERYCQKEGARAEFVDSKKKGALRLARETHLFLGHMLKNNSTQIYKEYIALVSIACEKTALSLASYETQISTTVKDIRKAWEYMKINKELAQGYLQSAARNIQQLPRLFSNPLRDMYTTTSTLLSASYDNPRILDSLQKYAAQMQNHERVYFVYKNKKYGTVHKSSINSMIMSDIFLRAA